MLPTDREERIRRRLEKWKEIVEEYDRRRLEAFKKGVDICPRCFSPQVIKRDRTKRRFECKDCGYTFAAGKLEGTELRDYVVETLLQSLVYGLNMSGAQSILKAVKWLLYKEDFKLSKAAIYLPLKRIVDEIDWLDEFIIKDMLEGVPCRKFEADDVFLHRSSRYRKMIEELHARFKAGEDISKRTTKRKRNSFSYLISGIDRESRYPFPVIVADWRDLGAFISFAIKARQFMRDDPEVVYSDDLAPLKEALKIALPSGRLEIIERVVGKNGRVIMKKGLHHQENLNKYYRRALKKGKKINSRDVAYNIARLVRLYRIFLEPHKALGGRTVIENLGVPMPKTVKTIVDLYNFARFVKTRYKEIIEPESQHLIENPWYGTLIISVYSTMLSPYHIVKVAALLNNWLNLKYRTDYLHCMLEAKLNDAPERLEYGSVLYWVNVSEKSGNAFHLVIPRVESGRYLIGVYRAGKAIIFFDVTVDPGKINHYAFDYDSPHICRAFLFDADIRALLEMGYDTKFLRRLAPAYEKTILARKIPWWNLKKEDDVNEYSSIMTNLDDVSDLMWYEKEISQTMRELEELIAELNAKHLVSLVFSLTKRVYYMLFRKKIERKLLSEKDKRFAALIALYLVLNGLHNISWDEYAKKLKNLIKLGKLELSEENLMLMKNLTDTLRQKINFNFLTSRYQDVRAALGIFSRPLKVYRYIHRRLRDNRDTVDKGNKPSDL